ncbi:MAG: hypothetical protein ACXWUG_07170 [Polyangiales bacterium]
MERTPAEAADLVAQRCLEVRSGERVAILAYGAEVAAPILARALEKLGAVVTRVALGSFEDPGSVVLADATIRNAVAGAQASIYVADPGAPAHLSLAVLRAVSAQKTRHVHLPGVTPKVLARAIADPDDVARINERVSELLAAPCMLRARGPGGTDLHVTIDGRFPLLARAGRPTADEADNLPAGLVAVHPSMIEGVFVADRGFYASGLRVDPRAVRRAPLRLELANGRIESVNSSDPSLVDEVHRYVDSHPNASRVSLVALPTNPLVTVEIGIDVHDALLPGLNVLFGFSQTARSKAPFDAPVQMRVHAMALDVETERGVIVAGGRLAADVVDR